MRVEATKLGQSQEKSFWTNPAGKGDCMLYKNFQNKNQKYNGSKKTADLETYSC